MAVIAVVNRKGGAGKSTLATHIACYLAVQGLEVMLGDVDRQQSSRLWLSLRPDTLPKIHGWTIDERNFARPPAGVKHVVLDTPGGFQGVGLMKVAMYADAILIPSTPSLFDRQAAADCVKELRTQPRVANGKCRVASIGMRIDGRTRNASLIAEWAANLQLQHMGTIREAQAYARCLEQGMSIFDFAPAKVANYLPEWSPVTSWLDEIVAGQAEAGREAEKARPGMTLPRSGNPGARLAAPVIPQSVALRPASATPAASPMPQAAGTTHMPAFLRA